MTKAFAYVISALILAGTYYALVLYPLVLDADVKLWLTGLAGAATTFVYGDQVASRTARNTLAASDSGADKALSTPTMTATGGDPAMQVTVESPPAPEA